MIKQIIKRRMTTQVREYDNFSIHGNSIKEVYDVPMSVINRPIPSLLDREKVELMKEVLKNPETEKELTPIDVHHVTYKGQDYYFAFGGCHRWAANKELGRETIRAKLIDTPPSIITTYLGSSSPFKN
ncbi:ParB/Sulfiredoxin [Cokeromyces recurvatus]|uniref:ParB/Sulfiredoxin n=1 Tax=Cokeromyces recurvatus TaxID=90255 RepID=UPI0022211108|nr:ParB/Sulfiredoxin [Cokeromyces recurvatus]KAI7903341.1 ParB/Sulfiredoxin [Cokeromyces recurvatus]